MTGQTIAYIRVSSSGQDYETQRDDVTRAGATKVFEEKASATTANRPQLSAMLDYVREGDTVVVTKIDRLARSTIDLLTLVKRFEDKGVAFRVLAHSIDTSNAAGKAFLAMLGVFAEFENNIRRERQSTGVAKAIAEGRFNPGRPKTLSREAIRELHEQGLAPVAISKKLGASRQGVHNVLSELNLSPPASNPEPQETAAP